MKGRGPVREARPPAFLLALLFLSLVDGLTPVDAQAPGTAPRSRDGDHVLRAIALADGRPASGRLSLIKGEYLRLLAGKNIERVAIADDSVASLDLITNREVLVLGRAPGLTSAIFWFPDGTSESISLVVQRDLAVLATALTGIHPSITVEGAPDRDAVLLQGLVPDVTFSRAAEAAARSYLASTRTLTHARLLAQPLVKAASGSASPPSAGTTDPPGLAAGELSARAEADEPTIIAPSTLPAADVAVLNLIRLETLPPTLEGRVRTAIGLVPGAARVTVRRVVRGAVPDDEVDLIILEGAVPDQIALTRILAVAAQIVVAGGRERIVTVTDDRRGGPTTTQVTEQARGADIRVLTDEGGGLVNLRSGTQGGGGAGSGSAFFQVCSNFNSAVQSTTGFGGGGGSGGGNQNQNTPILLNQNVARAQALSAAGGRIISFLRAADLPQVRIGVKLYEVNRTRLLSYTPTIIAAFSSQKLQGAPSPLLGNILTPDNFQQVVGFLSGVFTANSTLALGNVVIDAVFSALETQNIARNLSSPSLTVLNGEIAQFQVGGEIPVVTTFAPTTGAVFPGVFNAVTFVPIGLQVCARPLVGDSDTITIDLIPQIINPDNALTREIRNTTGVNPPTLALDARSLSTSTALLDGQSLLIAGLLSRKSDRLDNQTPLLSKVPLVRYLFSSFSDADDQRDLVLLVEPTIVRSPVAGISPWSYPGTRELMSEVSRPVAAPRPPPGAARPGSSR